MQLILSGQRYNLSISPSLYLSIYISLGVDSAGLTPAASYKSLPFLRQQKQTNKQ